MSERYLAAQARPYSEAGGRTFLSRLTTIAAVVFMLTSLSLAYLSKEQGGSSVVDKIKQEKTETAPVLASRQRKRILTKINYIVY